MRKTSLKSGQKTSRSFSRFRRKAERTATKVADNSVQHIEENLIAKAHKLRDIRLLVLEWVLMVFAIIILALLQSVWFTESYSSEVFSSGASFVEGTLGQVNSLNPLFASTNSERALSRLLFANLTLPDYSGHMGYGLADNVTAEDGGKVWRVYLRDNLKWSDGEPITTTDVLFTVELIQDPRITTAYSSNLTNVSVRIADDGAIVFTLPSAYADFSAALSFPILPRHILKGADPALLLEHEFSNAPVSSGPFRYNATQLSNGETVVYLSANPYYYNGRPMLDSFAIHSFASTDDIIAALNSGAITATAELSPVDADKISNSNIYEKQTAIASGIFLFMNNSSDLFRNKIARQALQKGIDIAAIRESVLGDEPALDYPLLKSQITLSAWPTLPAYDPDSAREALAQYADEPLVFATLSSGYLPALASKIEESLQSLGLDVELTVYDDVQEFMANVITTRDYDLLLYEVELGADPDPFAYYHSSQTGTSGSNLSNYNDAVSDSLIIAARNSLDANYRAGRYEAFLARWVEDAPAIGICQVNLAYFLNRNVRAFSEDDVLIFPIDRFVDVEIWSATKASKYKTP